METKKIIHANTYSSLSKKLTNAHVLPGNGARFLDTHVHTHRSAHTHARTCTYAKNLARLIRLHMYRTMRSSCSNYTLVGNTDVNSFGSFRWLCEWFSTLYDDIRKTNADRARANVIPGQLVRSCFIKHRITARINWQRLLLFSSCEIIKCAWTYRDRSFFFFHSSFFFLFTDTIRHAREFSLRFVLLNK